MSEKKYTRFRTEEELLKSVLRSLDLASNLDITIYCLYGLIKLHLEFLRIIF